MLRCLVCGLETEQTGGTVCWDCGIGKLIPVEAEEGQPETSDVDFDPYENDDAFDDGDEQTKDILKENRTITAAMVEGVPLSFQNAQAAKIQKAFRASQARKASRGATSAPQRSLFPERQPSTAGPMGAASTTRNSTAATAETGATGETRGEDTQAAQENLVSAGEKKVLEAAVATQLILVEKIKKFCEAYDKDGAAIDSAIFESELEAEVDQLFEGICTYHDIVGIADAAAQNIRNGADPMPFVTSSNWASMTGIVVTFVSIGILISSWRKMTNGERLLGVAQTTAQGVQMGAQMANAINAWVGPGAEGSSQAAANARIAAQATMVGAGAGIAAGVISMGIELSAAIKTGSVGKRYYEMRKKVPAFNRQIELAKTNQYGTAHLGMLHNLTNTKVKGEDYNPSEVDIVWLLWKVTKKMKRRKWRAEVGLTGAAASTASNGFALGTTIAAAAGTSAIPVIGWIFFGIATTCTFGALAYKVGRRRHKVAKLKAFRDELTRAGSDLWLPPSLSTSGDFNRFYVAIFLYWSLSDVSSPAEGGPTSEIKESATLWATVLFGGSPAEATRRVQNLGILGIMGYLKG